VGGDHTLKEGKPMSKNLIQPPSSFHVMGHRFPVRLVPPGRAMSNGGLEMTMGCTTQTEQFVELRTVERGSISPSQQADTYLHEALHAIMVVSGLRHTLELDQEAEEKLIHGLTPQILLFLRTNPRVVEYLLQRLP
jgi:hypothetical protein